MRFCIILLLLSFSSCSKKHIPLNYDSEDLPLIMMTRTACYGTCPQYTISIYLDGRIKYEGKLFVEKIGCFSSVISNKTLNSIKLELKSIDFFSFQKEYDTNITDLPSVICQVNIESKEHTVIDRFNGPKELKNLYKMIDVITANVVEWNPCQKSGQ